MSFSVPFLVKVGIYVQAVTKRDCCYSPQHLSENVLLRLPHRQFVFTILKILRLYFKNDRKLFADVSKIIFSIVNDYYNAVAKTAVKTGVVVSYQSYGDILRHNPHWHCIILEGGIDETNSFHYLPIKDTVGVPTSFKAHRSVQTKGNKIFC